jgi:hypothetical protein
MSFAQTDDMIDAFPAGRTDQPFSISVFPWGARRRWSRPDVVSVTWIRWIRESINSLLPVGGVGGDLTGLFWTKLPSATSIIVGSGSKIRITPGGQGKAALFYFHFRA